MCLCEVRTCLRFKCFTCVRTYVLSLVIEMTGAMEVELSDLQRRLMREQFDAIVKDSGVFVGGVVRGLNGEGRFDMRGMETPCCRLMALLSPAMRQLPRGLRRRREHATVHRVLPDKRILIAWVYTTLIVVQQDLRTGDGVPLSLQGCRCDYSDEEVVIACGVLYPWFVRGLFLKLRLWSARPTPQVVSCPIPSHASWSASCG